MTITANAHFDMSTVPASGAGRSTASRAARQRAERAQQLRDRKWQYIHAPGFEEAEDDSAGEFLFERTDDSAPRAGRNADFYVAFLYRTEL
jgi:hypothetical protein